MSADGVTVQRGQASPRVEIAAPPRRALPPGPPLPRPLQMALYGFEPYRFFAWAKKRYGSVYTVRLMGETWVVLTEPEHVRELFAHGADVFDAGPANRPLRPFIGLRNLFFLDGAEHLARRKLVLPPFHGEAMRAHEGAIRDLVAAELQGWRTGRRFAALTSMRSITFRVMMRVVIGDTPAAEQRALVQTIWDLVTWAVDKRRAVVYALAGPDRLMQLPGYRRHVAALDELLFAEIRRRRTAGDEAGDDVLAQLLLAHDHEGQPLTDDDVRDEIVSLVLAGHETTTGLLSWAVHELARSPETQERLAAGEPGFAGAVVTEVLRLHSPATMTALRQLRQPMTFDGVELPAGTIVVVSPTLVHRRDDLYSDPRAFRPDRFVGSRPGAGTWFPFGGGMRRCIGAALAQFQARIVLEELAARFRLEPASRRPELIDRHGFVAVPARGARVVAQPRASAG